MGDRDPNPAPLMILGGVVVGLGLISIAYVFATHDSTPLPTKRQEEESPPRKGPKEGWPCPQKEVKCPEKKRKFTWGECGSFCYRHSIDMLRGCY